MPVSWLYSYRRSKCIEHIYTAFDFFACGEICNKLSLQIFRRVLQYWKNFESLNTCRGYGQDYGMLSYDL